VPPSDENAVHAELPASSGARIVYLVEERDRTWSVALDVRPPPGRTTVVAFGLDRINAWREAVTRASTLHCELMIQPLGEPVKLLEAAELRELLSLRQAGEPPAAPLAPPADAHAPERRED
jgi:hypothetical protein